ncbi:CACTA en-spm transposon protein [Cucumis melo var. makuwa]|uniref:CACTA en-spm transposon protein n=1 Tax=Cucumis melo var. makuwa TaxID=1194695 RepID=A0A5A7V2B1_CUCMM|nr:CACTA en-spm transposon protein [Cucumis melo var. makuwa]TYK26625.1 CACTA en-spm transposon protein [Cucumis melo var. makuwa]
MPEVDDVENKHLNILEIVVSHRVDEHIEDDTMCRTDVDPKIVKRSIVRHVTDDIIDDMNEHLSHASHMASFSSGFNETDTMFLEFVEALDNPTGGSSSVGDNSKLECYVASNGWILMKIAPGAKKPISPHAIHFSRTIGMCARKTFSICCLKWMDVGREYIEVVKADLQRFFVLDFNNQAMDSYDTNWRTNKKSQCVIFRSGMDVEAHRRHESGIARTIHMIPSLSDSRYRMAYEAR